MEKPIYAIGYARVSSPKQAQEGESLDIQSRVIKTYITNQGWKLFPEDYIFSEPFSGTTSNRPLYQAALDVIRKNPGKIKYFVVRYIDRFSRGGALEYQTMKRELAKEGVELRDTVGIIQPTTNSLEMFGMSYDWSNSSPSKISEIVVAESASFEKSNILIRLIGAEINLVQSGYKVRSPNDGYINSTVEVNGKKKCIQVPDPKRAHFIIEIFKLRAEGIYSDAEIVRRINAMGYLSRSQKKWDKSGTILVGRSVPKKMTVKKLQRIIERPIYCAVVCEKWTHYQPIKAKYKGLVDIDTFNKANRGKVFIKEHADGSLEILYNQNLQKVVNKRHRFRDEYPYKNVTLCSICNKPLLASKSRGKSGKYFNAYHCTRSHKRYAVSQTELESKYSEFLSKIRFTDEFVSVIEEVALMKYRKEEGDLAKNTAQANRAVADLEDEKSNLIKAFTNAVVPEMQRGIETQVASIQKSIDEAKEYRQKIEVNENDVHKFISHTKKLVEHPANMLANPSNMQEQIALFSLFFERFPTYEELANGTPKLTLVFKLHQENTNEKSLSVTLLGIEPSFKP